MIRLVIEIDKDKYDRLDYLDVITLKEIIRNGKPLTKNPTNGDVIKALFSDAKVNVTKYSYVVEVKLPYHTEYDTGLLFDREWWNSPYKEEDDM